MEPIDALVSSCADLATTWSFLVVIMTLCVVGVIISLVAIISDCAAPCAEEKYEGKRNQV